jgi:hypothetical protein
MTSRAAAVQIATVLEQVGVHVRADEPDKIAALLAGLATAVGTTYDATE